MKHKEIWCIMYGEGGEGGRGEGDEMIPSPGAKGGRSVPVPSLSPTPLKNSTGKGNFHHQSIVQVIMLFCVFGVDGRLSEI